MQPAPTKKIPVMELFGPTIQGEGLVAGLQTFFIRFGLCDYKCTMCDSMHAVDPEAVKANARWLTQPQIFDEIIDKMKHHQWITFSGGNPCIHDLTYLVEMLLMAGKHICVETQGTLDPEWLKLVDIITISPKSPGMGEKFERNKFEAFIKKYYRNSSVKVVVFSAQDLEFAAAIWQILEETHVKNYQSHERHYPNWKERFFLSLGNPYPPELQKTQSDETTSISAKETAPRDHIAQLLKSFDQLSEDLMLDPRLKHARFLPQLHVLVWGNEQGR